jgi:hypothetical protein
MLLILPLPSVSTVPLSGIHSCLTDWPSSVVRGVTCAVGRGKSKGAAKAAAAQVVYEDFLANGVPGT